MSICHATGARKNCARRSTPRCARKSVAILLVEEAADDFDARFSAKARHYLYRIVNRRAPLTFDAGRAWLVKRELDADAMHAAAQCLGRTP